MGDFTWGQLRQLRWEGGEGVELVAAVLALVLPDVDHVTLDVKTYSQAGSSWLQTLAGVDRGPCSWLPSVAQLHALRVLSLLAFMLLWDGRGMVSGLVACCRGHFGQVGSQVEFMA